MKGFENPVECLNSAAEAIKFAIDIGIYRGHLCCFGGTFAMRPPLHTPEAHPIIFTVTKEMTQKGLSTTEWNDLSTAMWNYFKEKI